MKAHLVFSMITMLLLFCLTSTATPLAPSLTVTRLNQNQPIIDEASFTALGIAGEGHNIGGPSCVRVPDWVAAADRADPTAQYYLYFSNHSGKYIRMAWAANIQGPWSLFNCGTANDTRVAGRGVLDMGPADEIEFTSADGIRVSGHIASPDVIVDHTNQQFILYFHGPAEGPPVGNNYFDTGEQKTLAATSASGLNFNLPTGTANVSGGVGGGELGHGLKNAVLGNAYFRTFKYDDNLYAFSNYGPIWKAPSAATPWETTNTTVDVWTEGPVDTNPVYVDLASRYDLSPGGQPPRHYAGYTGDYGTKEMPRKGGPRHFATLMQDDGKTLEVWYTCRGDKPERIFRTTMDLSQGTWETWDTVVSDTNTVHQEMLRPELDWEGADQPLDFSKNGSETDENQLRDPYLFRDADGQIYLFYSGEGEEAIGIANVHPLDTDRDGMSDDDENVAGTNPADSNSVFRVEASFSSDPDSIRWLGATGRIYQIDYSTNLISWIPLHQDIAASPPTNQHSVSSAPDEDDIFFRLKVRQ